jgi:hypothetical protein
MHPNAEVVRRAYEAFNTANVELLTETFADNASWHTPGRGRLAGSRSDRGETFAQFGRYMEATNGTFKAELQYVCADDDGRVVAFHQNTGARNGRATGGEHVVDG